MPASSGASRIALTLTVWFLASAATVAQQPVVDHLFPSGGQQGQTVSVTLGGKPGKEPLQVWSDNPGLTFEMAAENKSCAITIAPDARRGPCWVRFYNAAGAAELRPFVVGQLNEVNEVEPNNEWRAAQSIDGSDAVINGVLQKSGDVDTFTIPLQKGQTLVASLQAQQTLGSPMDAGLQLLDPSGTVVSWNDDSHGFDPQIVSEIPADGNWTIRTFAFPAAPNSTVRFAGGAAYIYRLTLTTGPYVDHTVPVTVQAGTAVDAVAQGWNLEEQTRITGRAEASDRTSLTLDAPGAGTVSLDIVAHSVTAEANNEQLQSLTLPVSLTGHITAAGERDTYQFTGTKGQKVQLDIVAQSRHSPLDPVLTLRTAEGKMIKEADDASRDNRDPSLSVTLPADGLYNVEVRDRFGHGGMRYVYVLNGAAPVATATASVAASRFVISDEKPLEIPVTIKRINGFKKEVTFAAEGLPEGVTCDAVVSAGDGDTAGKITLVLKSTRSEGHGGPFRIVGQVADTDQSLPATAGVPAGKTTATLWLTVPPKGAGEGE